MLESTTAIDDPEVAKAVVNTDVPLNRGVASHMPDTPDARLLTAMKASCGDTTKESSNSSALHSSIWPYASMLFLPSVPE